MIRNLVLGWVLVNIGLASAQPATDAQLQVSGRALANYQGCAEVALEIGDKVMNSYYSDMFADLSAQVNTNSDSDAVIVAQAFNHSISKLRQLNRSSLATYCDSRFEPLTLIMP